MNGKLVKAGKIVGYWTIILFASGASQSAWMFLAGLWFYILINLPKPKPDATRESVLEELKTVNFHLDMILRSLERKPPSSPPPGPDAP